MAQESSTLKTPLYPWHLKLGAKMVDFNGWEMPIQYEGILAEHQAVRESVGIFDISHMGTIDILGLNALDFVQDLITNDASHLSDGKALYSPVCLPSGGVVDDVLVYRLENRRYRFVVNAGNRKKDFDWFAQQSKDKHVEICCLSDANALVAVQGPNSRPLLQDILKIALGGVQYYSFFFADWNGQPLMISRTGYTGELGYEVFLPAESVGAFWEKLLEQGKRYGVKPVGLGARDTLRMEMGYCLYGHEIDDAITPLEAGLSWTVAFQKARFIGKDALLAQQKQGLTRRLVGVKMLGKAIPRAGCEILLDGKPAGKLTSGGFSPSLGCGIGMGFVPAAAAKEGKALAVRIRETNHQAQVVRIPFYGKKATSKN